MQSPQLIITKDVGGVVGSFGGAVKVSGAGEDIIQGLKALHGVSLGQVVLVWDINPLLVGRFFENLLLKILESLTVDVIFISSGDSFSDVFLSRFVLIKKYLDIIPNKFNSVFSLKNMEYDQMDVGFVVSECPGVLPFFLLYGSSSMSAKRKVFNLL